MELILEILIFAAAAANLLFTLDLWLRSHRHDAEDECDAEVSAAKEEARQRDLVGEGLDNIMMFSVNGKTGFEPENWREE